MRQSSNGANEKFADYAVGFLNDVLGFDTDRVNQRIIARVAESLNHLETTSRQREAALIAAVTVGETYFLRHKCHFAWFTDDWLSTKLAERTSQKAKFGSPKRKELRILCAGCATGEEPYSVAAMLQRKQLPGDLRVRIDAFDVNEEFLLHAREARYRIWSLRNVDLGEHDDWLTLDGSQVRVREEVQNAVDFYCHNLLTPLDRHQQLADSYDLIFCRNVLLYFHQRAVQLAYHHLADALTDDGHLVVGPSDPAPPAGGLLKGFWKDGVRYLRRCHPVDRGSTTGGRELPTIDDGDDTGEDASDTRSSGRESALSPASGVCEVARRLSRMSDKTVAVQFLKRHLDEQPVDVEAYVLGALYAAEIEKFDLAFSWGRRAAFLAPNAPYVVFVLGDICARSGRNELVGRYRRWAEQLLAEYDPDEPLRYSDGCRVHQLMEVLRGQR